jgi:hypothetical protein
MSGHEASRSLGDRAEIQDLLDSYFVAFEQRRFDDEWVRSTFTDDVVLEFPPGTHAGVDGLAAFHEEIAALWERTLHHTTNHAFRFDGDRAVVRAKLTATHVHRADDPGAHLHIGGYVDAEVLRTGDGWRVRRLRLELVWTEGDPPSPVHAATAATRSHR